MSVFLPKTSFLKAEKAATRVGKDTLAYCSRCKMNLAHVIVTASHDNKPLRVQCRTCHSERNFKAPKTKDEIAQDGGLMSDRDEDLNIDSIDVTKALLGETPKKKSKNKSKAKKSRDDADSKSSSKLTPQLPLSLQKASSEDLATYEAKLVSQKHALSSAKSYSPQVRFAVGDVLEHKTFGIGFVVLESGLNKMEVLFKEGRKLLVMAPQSK